MSTYVSRTVPKSEAKGLTRQMAELGYSLARKSEHGGKVMLTFKVDVPVFGGRG